MSENNSLKRSERLFTKASPWKVVIIMMAPMTLLMLFTGAYLFMDTVLAVNLAGKNYLHEADYFHVPKETLVRFFMTGPAPISAIITAFIFLFAIGISSRVQVNRGRGDIKRAKMTMKSGSMIGIVFSIVIIPILIFTAKPWISSQYPTGPINDLIVDKGFDYILIIILSAPFQMFNQIVSMSLRNEARNKEMLVALIVPIFINLLFDYILMGPLNMGVTGGAWATFISYVITTIILTIFVLRRVESLVKFRNIFGIHISWITLIGVFLVGIAPFVRNFSQSLTSTFEMSTIKDISSHVYAGQPNASLYMTMAFTGVGPIFALLFPVMFAPVQAGRPIASFNYGAGHIKRVKQVVIVTTIYTIGLAVIIYFLAAWILSEPLLDVLKVTGGAKILAVKALKIFMVSVFPFALIVGVMTLAASTDRIFLNLIITMLRGIILFFPVLYLYKYLAINHPSIELLFWWFYPTVNGLSTLVALSIGFFIWKNLQRKHLTLEERLAKIYERFKVNTHFEPNIKTEKTDPKTADKNKIIAAKTLSNIRN